MNAFTVRLDEKLASELDALAERTGHSKNEQIREALRSQLAIANFQDLRQKVRPFAEARGWLTDDDVIRVSRCGRG